jgi:hypothetical protein
MSREQRRISLLSAFREGLSTTGYVEGHNVRIEYRWAEAHSGDCQSLRHSWFVSKWQYLSPRAAPLLHWPQRLRREPYQSFSRPRLIPSALDLSKSSTRTSPSHH